MSAAEQLQLLSVDEYLQGEAACEVRHEYLAGTVHAMAGASRRHNRLVRNIEKMLNGQFGSGPCEAWSTDLKLHVRTAIAEYFYYPDVMVGCDPADNHEYYLENPAILFEVLSPSTEQIDKREKFHVYLSIPSLFHYVIVSQEERRVEWLQREGNSWKVSVLTAEADRIDFPAQIASITLAEIYEGIEFE